jgi:thiol-disulfide isomerase/thioredoxin
VQVETLQVKQAQPATKKEPRKRKTKRWLGLAVANMKEPIPGAPSAARAMIQRAHRGGPGHKAGLQRGDVIIEAGGQEVGPYQDYIEQARLKEIGEHLPLKVLRDGRPIVVSVPLIEKPANGKVWRRQHFPGSEAFSWTLPGVRPQVQLSDRKTSPKPQLLYFWASWCGPCRQTSPLVNQLHRDAADRLEVIAVSSEERKVIEDFLKKGGTQYAVAHDTEGLVKLDYEVQSLPTIVWLTGDRVTDWDYGIGGVRRVVQKLRRELEI